MNRNEVCPSCDAVVPLESSGRIMLHIRVVKPQLIQWNPDLDPQAVIETERCPGSGRYINEP